MATGWALALLLCILLGSGLILSIGAIGVGQFLRLQRRYGSLEPGPDWLSGTARPRDGDTVDAPVSNEPALYVDLALEREGGKVARRVWRTVVTRREGVPFSLETDDGRVRVDPAHASLNLDMDHVQTFDDLNMLTEALPASIASGSLDQADRYRLTERRLSPGDKVDATGTLDPTPDGSTTLAGSEPSIVRRLVSVPFVLADPGRDGGRGVLRDRALAGFVLGLPPGLLALVLLFPP